MLTAQRLAGAISRALPRAHGPFERWLARHPGESPISYRDSDGLWRTADLRDHLERAHFAGVRSGPPRSVLDRIPPGSLAIDVGANIGIVTGQMARAVSRDGRVWAIEPVPRNVARLRDLTQRNRLSIDVVEAAAGAGDGELELRLADDAHSGWASMTASWIDAGRLVVSVRSIDSLMAERRPDQPLSFVKIDVEGYEIEVLGGAQATLETWRPLVYAEFNDIILRDRGSSSHELLGQFATAGYRPAPAYRDRSLDRAVVDLLLEPAPPLSR